VNNINKPLLQVILKEEENYCAKCCKTQQVVERMLLEIPLLKEKVDVEYESITTKKNAEKYSNMIPPIVLINGTLFSEGHVPIIKKLSNELIKLSK
jgi:hypothetical protein